MSWSSNTRLIVIRFYFAQNDIYQICLISQIWFKPKCLQAEAKYVWTVFLCFISSCFSALCAHETSPKWKSFYSTTFHHFSPVILKTGWLNVKWRDCCIQTCTVTQAAVLSAVPLCCFSFWTWAHTLHQRQLQLLTPSVWRRRAFVLAGCHGES